jgi:hypothetical protein
MAVTTGPLTKAVAEIAAILRRSGAESSENAQCIGEALSQEGKFQNLALAMLAGYLRPIEDQAESALAFGWQVFNAIQPDSGPEEFLRAAARLQAECATAAGREAALIRLATVDGNAIES